MKGFGFLPALLGSALTASGPFTAPCPDTSRAWNDWRSERIAEILNPGYDKERIAFEAQSFLDRCDPARALTGFDRFRRWLRAISWSADPDHFEGYDITDSEQDLEADPFTQVPPELSRPQLLRDIGDPATVDHALTMLEATAPPDWKILRFDSRHLRTADDASAHGRILVYVPGAELDRLVQFGVGDEPGVRSNSLTVVSLERRPLSKSRVWFRDRWVDRSTMGEFEVQERPWRERGSVNCVFCHKSGALPILPGKLYRPGDEATVAWINRRIRDLGPPDFGPHLDAKAFGPPMAPEETVRTDAFFSRCTQGVELRDPSVSRPRIAQAMNCAKCHEPGDRGSLNFPQGNSGTYVTNLVQSFILSGQMPPKLGQKLEEQPGNHERSALVKCLEEEYYGEGGDLRRWLANGAD